MRNDHAGKHLQWTSEVTADGAFPRRTGGYHREVGTSAVEMGGSVHHLGADRGTVGCGNGSNNGGQL